MKKREVNDTFLSLLPDLDLLTHGALQERFARLSSAKKIGQP